MWNEVCNTSVCIHRNSILQPDLHIPIDNYALLVNVTAIVVKMVQPNAKLYLQIAHDSNYAAQTVALLGFDFWINETITFNDLLC